MSKNQEIIPKKSGKETINAIQYFFTFLKPYLGKFSIGLIFLVLSSATALAFPSAIGDLLDLASGKLSNQNIDINQIAIFLLVTLILQSVFSYFRIILFAQVSENFLADIRKALFQKMIQLPMTFFGENRIGDLNSRSTSDLAQIQDTFMLNLPEFLRGIITLIVGVGFILLISVKLTLIMLLSFPVLIIAAIFFGKFIRKMSKKTQDKLAEVGTIVEETLQGIMNVKVFTNEAWEINRHKNKISETVSIALHGAYYRAGFTSFIIFSIFGSIIFVLFYGAIMVQNQEITMGSLTKFIFYTVFVGGAIGGFSEHYSQIQKMAGATERVREILAEKGEPIDIQNQIFPNRSIQGKIQFVNVKFSYPNREDFDVLKNVNFTVNSGQKIALVGQSGAGKSTITALLLRLFPFHHGGILIDDKNINEYDLSFIRSQMAIVPQDVLLFGGSIYENIAYGNLKATESEVYEAAKKANAHLFIESFPDKYQTLVGERGIKLSGGQRQRIAIARAILKNPSILILDEATSSLDAESEKLVQDALNLLMEGRTTLIIAHRLATIRNVDSIFVLKEGQIIEQGTHDQLVKIEDGIYANLAKLQFEI